MIEHAWSVICDKTIIDQDTNNISLDVIEQINFIKVPIPEGMKGIIIPAPLIIVSLWYRIKSDSPCRGRSRVKILSPSDEQVGVVEIDIDLTQHQRCRTRCRINGLPVPNGQSGIFHFIVDLFRDENWAEVAKIPLEVQLSEEQSAKP